MRASRAIRGIAVSPDGKLLATAGSDRRILLWDTASGPWRQHCKGHADPVGAVASRQTANARQRFGGQNAILWDVAKREERHTLEGHGEAVTAVAFSPAANSSPREASIGRSGCGKPRPAVELANLEEGHKEAVRGSLSLPSAGRSPRRPRTRASACGRPPPADSFHANAGGQRDGPESLHARPTANSWQRWRKFAVLIQDAAERRIVATSRDIAARWCSWPSARRFSARQRGPRPHRHSLGRADRQQLACSRPSRTVRAAAFSPDGGSRRQADRTSASWFTICRRRSQAQRSCANGRSGKGIRASSPVSPFRRMVGFWRAARRRQRAADRQS